MAKKQEAMSASDAAAPMQAPLTPNAAMRRLAHQRLDELMDDAEARRFYGAIAVETTWEAGQIVLVRRKIEGTDKR
jgi:hypothetical protein